MNPTAARTFRTGEFAALSGVTPRALRYYDRLGLVKPRRSSSGYRVYSERDLQALEEIVALKFIGVPLKEIGAIRRRAKGSFGQVLRAQRETLEAKRRTLARAIAAICAAETSLQSVGEIDAEALRRIIEAMHMDTQHEQNVAAYTAMLKRKVSHLSALSAEQRASLQQQWSALVEDVKAAIHEDPADSKPQELLDRWLSLLQALTGTNPLAATTPGGPHDSVASQELREELWARRADWLPADAVRETRDVASVDEAQARVLDRINAFAGSDVLEFIRRARAARG